jgi:hypothetical protein
MKAVFLTIVLLSAQAMAQSNTMEAPSLSTSNNKTEGIKIAVIKSMLEAELEYSSDDTDTDDNISLNSADVEQSVGFLIGYQSTRAFELAYNIQLAYNLAEVDNVDFNSIRLEGNLGYGFNDSFHLLGGINFVDYVGDVSEEYETDLGLQFGGGANIQNFNVSLMYYLMRNSAELPSFLSEQRIELNVSGLEH